MVEVYRKHASRFRKVLELTECNNFTNEENPFFKDIEEAVAECQWVSYRPQNQIPIEKQLCLLAQQGLHQEDQEEGH